MRKSQFLSGLAKESMDQDWCRHCCKLANEAASRAEEAGVKWDPEEAELEIRRGDIFLRGEDEWVIEPHPGGGWEIIPRKDWRPWYGHDHRSSEGPGPSCQRRSPKLTSWLLSSVSAPR